MFDQQMHVIPNRSHAHFEAAANAVREKQDSNYGSTGGDESCGGGSRFLETRRMKRNKWMSLSVGGSVADPLPPPSLPPLSLLLIPENEELLVVVTVLTLPHKENCAPLAGSLFPAACVSALEQTGRQGDETDRDLPTGIPLFPSVSREQLTLFP